MKLKAGTRCITNGGWEAVICEEHFISVWHSINGGVLYSHNKDGSVRSDSVGDDYSLKFIVIPIESKK